MNTEIENTDLSHFSHDKQLSYLIIFRAAIYLSLFENSFITDEQVFSFLKKQYSGITIEFIKDVLEISYKLGGVVKSCNNGNNKYCYLGFLDSNSRYCFKEGVFLYTKGSKSFNYQSAINYLDNIL